MLGLGLLLLRAAPEHGLAAVVVVFAVVWGTDSGAFFVGRAIGGPKLWPAVSPKKTWAGAVGGLVAGVVAGLVVAALARVPVAPGLALVCAVLSLAGQAGDLFESGHQAPFRRQGFRHHRARPRRPDGPRRRSCLRRRRGGDHRPGAWRAGAPGRRTAAMVTVGAAAIHAPRLLTEPRRVTILGATGSIGTSTLSVIAERAGVLRRRSRHRQCQQYVAVPCHVLGSVGVC